MRPKSNVVAKRMLSSDERCDAHCSFQLCVFFFLLVLLVSIEINKFSFSFFLFVSSATWKMLMPHNVSFAYRRVKRAVEWNAIDRVAHKYVRVHTHTLWQMQAQPLANKEHSVDKDPSEYTFCAIRERERDAMYSLE